MENNLFMVAGYAIDKEHEKPLSLQELLSKNLDTLWIPLCIVDKFDSPYGEEFLKVLSEEMEPKALIVSIKYHKTFLA